MFRKVIKEPGQFNKVYALTNANTGGNYCKELLSNITNPNIRSLAS